MEFVKRITAVILFGLLVAITSNSHAYVLTTSGTWESGETSNGGQPSGIGTDTIAWGRTNGTQSSYVFGGVTVDPLDPSDMLWNIGSFTHNNFPIYNPTLVKATLGIDIDIFDGSSNVYSGSYTFDFRHKETRNYPSSGECKATGHSSIPYGGCPDVVKFDSSYAKGKTDGLVTLGGKTYEFDVFGFFPDADSKQPNKEFVTYEKRSNSTYLYAKLKRVQVPEIDGSGAGLALGLMLSFILLLREKGLLY